MATTFDIRYRTTETIGAPTHAPLPAAPASMSATFARRIVKVNAGSANALAGGRVR